MSHPYTTQARVELFLGAERVTALCDRDEDGSIDTGLVADAIERTSTRIDGALATRYVVPFAGIADATPTPGQVADLCDLGVGMLLFAWLAPKQADAAELRERFEGTDTQGGLLGSYRKGIEKVVGATEIAASDGARSAAYESTGTSIAGAQDSSGDRTAAWSQTDSKSLGEGI